MASEALWKTGWGARFRELAKERGCSSLLAFLQQNPSLSVDQLAALVEPAVAPIAIVAAVYDEARLTGTVQAAAQELLYRAIREHLPNGWGIAERVAWRRNLALSGWASELEVTGQSPNLANHASAVAKLLCACDIPDQWLPASAEDATLVAAFQEAWPVI